MHFVKYLITMTDYYSEKQVFTFFLYTQQGTLRQIEYNTLLIYI